MHYDYTMAMPVFKETGPRSCAYALSGNGLSRSAEDTILSQLFSKAPFHMSADNSIIYYLTVTKIPSRR